MVKNNVMLERLKAARGQQGFTLMEMLIVIAIIAILIAIAIPVFTAQLENSREATDAANIRSAYGEVVARSLSDPDTPVNANVEKEQQVTGWQNDGLKNQNIAGIPVNTIGTANNNFSVTYTPASGSDDAYYQIDGTNANASFTTSN